MMASKRPKDLDRRDAPPAVQLRPQQKVYASSNRTLIPSRPHIVRYTLRLHVDASENDETKLIDSFKKLYSYLRTIDPSTIIYRWYDNDLINPNISTATAVPVSIGKLRKYCPRITPKKAGGDVYTSIRLGYTLPSDQFRDEAAWWINNNKHGLWPCSIQAEHVSCVGWLLYSIREHDAAALTEAITSTIGIQVGLRWRPINRGRTVTTITERVRALHVEVATSDVPAAKSKLQQLYSTSTTAGFPNGIRFRLVPEVSPLISAALRTKVDRLIARQEKFSLNILRIPSWELTAIDHSDRIVQASLRTILTAIRSKTHPTLQLFHSVDKSWNGSCHIFSVLPKLEQEARGVVTGLLPYLRATYPQYLSRWDSYFTTSAVERAGSARWDIDEHSLITADDSIIHDLLAEQDEFDLDEEIPSNSSAPRSPGLAHSLGNGNSFDLDHDSVSTLNHDSRQPRRPSHPAANANHQHTSGAPSSPPGSTLSSLTVEERLSSLEDKLDRSLSLMLTTFKQMMQAPSPAPAIDAQLGPLPSRDSADTPPSVGGGP